MLALDFDGVLCDALTECAAVTWHAVHSPSGTEPPTLAVAVATMPEAFLVTFASIRPMARTLADFMVAHVVPAGQSVDRRQFDHYRDLAGPEVLAAQAESGERIRSHWRETEPEQWLALHTVYAEVATHLRSTRQPVAIVSAKDAASIWAILTHHRLSGSVGTVYGSCVDKTPVLATLRAAQAGSDANPLLFVDDNLDHALAAAQLPGVESRWAMWGYHTAEDLLRPESAVARPLTLDQLAQLDHVRLDQLSPH